jgi:cytochrome c1
MRKLIAAGGLILSFLVAPVLAQGNHGPELLKTTFSFEGRSGTYDRGAARRGYQVYKEVCSACHALSLLSYSDLKDLGFTEDTIKALAAEAQVEDVDDKGEKVERPARPSDRFRNPFPNPAAAAEANNGVVPPDLSLIIKARPDGARYVYSLLQGYEDFDKLSEKDKAVLGLAKDYKLEDGKYFNKFFRPGAQGYKISMPMPLGDDQVAFEDGSRADVASMAHDVVTFLAWAANACAPSARLPVPRSAGTEPRPESSDETRARIHRKP